MFERSKASDDSSNAPADCPVRDGTRFAALWTRTVPGAPAVAAMRFARLAQLYGEPHRRYHTLDHVGHCLDEFDRVATLLDDPDAVEMALWFHDAIYTPGARDNEWRSAELFRQWSDGQADAAFRQRVRDLIMVTTHRGPPRQGDERFMVDIDLSGFGQPWDEFERDGRLLRAEYAEMADEEYYPGQLRFLLSLQNRPTFFFAAFFKQRYERTARANTRRLVESLLARGYGGA